MMQVKTVQVSRSTQYRPTNYEADSRIQIKLIVHCDGTLARPQLALAVFDRADLWLLRLLVLLNLLRARLLDSVYADQNLMCRFVH